MFWRNDAGSLRSGSSCSRADAQGSGAVTECMVRTDWKKLVGPSRGKPRAPNHMGEGWGGINREAIKQGGWTLLGEGAEHRQPPSSSTWEDLGRQKAGPREVEIHG